MTPEPLTPKADLPSPTEGDDYTYAVSFTNRSSLPIDITGWTVSMTVAEDDGTPIIEKDITTHDDATGGKTSWSMSASDTSGLSSTKDYDIQVVKSDGTTRTVVIGTIAFIDGVTDRTISGSGGSGAGASAGASIDVTLGDDSVAINVRGLTNYTDSDAVGALDGATITPGQVGTEANPVKQQHAESISSGELSVTDGLHSETRDFLTYLEDIDTATPLALDTGALTDYPLYEIRGWAKLPSGTANTPLNATINNDTATNYRWYDSADNPTVGATEWRLAELSQYRHVPFDLTVYSGHGYAQNGNARPGFSLDVAAYASRTDRGSFASNGTTVDSMQFATANNCVFRASVIGVSPY